MAGVCVQIFSQVFHEVQSELSQECRQPARHAPLSGQDQLQLFIGSSVSSEIVTLYM